MTVEANKETLGFQTEVKQLLHLMIHSLYSNKEIFLRELISNASDAEDKLRFAALKDDKLFEGDSDLKIRLDYDKDAGTITIADNGIGMTRDDVIANLGTIAKSGTAEFLKQLSGDEKKDSKLIGQFGVGFYSAFIVADKVEVFTRKAGEPADNGVHWESKGDGEFTIEPVSREQRGTEIVLHLKPEDKEFADGWKLRSLVKKYSDHISFPVVMKSESEEEDKKGEEETVNDATALWTLPRTEIKDEEYKEFYKHIAHDFEDPLTWSHNKVEGKLDYTSLLYIPKRAPFDLYNREAPRGLKLYVQRVFIMDDAEQFLPLYLRFVKGVIDAPNLPLNVSRELLQDYGPVRKIRAALTKRVLQTLKKLGNDEEKYATFWSQFGEVLKEGIGEDPDNREAIAALLRFPSTEDVRPGAVGLDQYLERAGEKQDKIYYLLADNLNAARNSPHLEVFRKKGIEVLLLTERVDEWMAGYLGEYKGCKLVNAARGQLDMDQEDQERADQDKQAPLIGRLSDSLGDQVAEVRPTSRLVDSPACLVLAEDELGPQMRMMLEAAGQPVPDSKPTLEVNLAHPLLQRLEGIEESATFTELAELLLDQALLAEGQLPSDPAATARRLNRLLQERAGQS